MFRGVGAFFLCLYEMPFRIRETHETVKEFAGEVGELRERVSSVETIVKRCANCTPQITLRAGP